MVGFMLESHRQHKAKAQWANLRRQAVETRCQEAKAQCQEAKPLDQQPKAQPRPELLQGEPDPNTTDHNQRQEVTKQGDGHERQMRQHQKAPEP